MGWLLECPTLDLSSTPRGIGWQPGQSHGSQFSSDSISNWQYSDLAPLNLSFLSERKKKKDGRRGREKEQERNKEQKLEKKKNLNKLVVPWGIAEENWTYILELGVLGQEAKS